MLNEHLYFWLSNDIKTIVVNHHYTELGAKMLMVSPLPRSPLHRYPGNIHPAFCLGSLPRSRERIAHLPARVLRDLALPCHFTGHATTLSSYVVHHSPNSVRYACSSWHSVIPLIERPDGGGGFFYWQSACCGPAGAVIRWFAGAAVWRSLTEVTGLTRPIGGPRPKHDGGPDQFGQSFMMQ